ncbi:MAG: threonine aldolase family protein [Opitutales bacterium]
MSEAIDRTQFASDNTSTAAPEVLAAVQTANQGFAGSYGGDATTRAAADRFRSCLETDVPVYFCFNGSVANSLVLAQVCQPFDAVLCHPLGHVDTDECAAPEFFTGGAKLLTVDGPDGKIDPARIEPVLARGHGIHSSRPRVLSLTQSTEVGTVYSVDEIKALCAAAHEAGLLVHMDGARFANALAHLGCSPADLTWRAGVDLLTVGGTKNGGFLNEAVVFFDVRLAEGFEYRRKQGGQLASKMRFLSAGWLGLLENDVWLRNARQANRAAQRLAAGLSGIDSLELAFPVEANAVFVRMPAATAAALHHRGWHVYPFTDVNAWRFMCSWCTDDAAVDALLADAREIGKVK